MRRTHPSVFLFLIVPFGAMGGYLSVAIGYQLTQAGVSVEDVAALVAASYIPQTWKFLWAPLADTTLSRKTWYLLAGLVSALGIFVTGAVPADAASLPLLYAAVLISNVASTFLAMATESLMVYNTPPELQGRAGGWFQAGNLGGNGLGGGAGLWLAQTLPDPWMAAAVIAIACALCCAALWFVPEPPPLPRTGHYGRMLVAVLKDLWQVVRARAGILALLICFLPIGSGAASNLWSAVADDWHASANTVALATGVFSGIVSALGCLFGGYGADRMDRKTAYALYGLLMAISTVAMALAPRTETMYVVFTLDLRLHPGADLRGLHRGGARNDRPRRGGDQVQPVRFAVEHADRVHDAGRRLGAYPLGRGRIAQRRGRIRRRGHHRFHCRRDSVAPASAAGKPESGNLNPSSRRFISYVS